MKQQFKTILLLLIFGICAGEILSKSVTLDQDSTESDEESTDKGNEKDVPNSKLELLKKLQSFNDKMKNFLTTNKIIDNSKEDEKKENEIPEGDIEMLQKWMNTLNHLGYDSNQESEVEDSNENPEEALRLLATLPEEHETPEITPEDEESEKLYSAGMVQLNKTRGDKTLGYKLISQAAARGHKEALIKFAWAKLFGSHMDQNIDEAKNIFQSLADDGYPDAQMGLGLLYASGIGLNVSQAKALVYLTTAALGDSTWAQMALGYRYWAGVTVPTQCEKALYFYKKVATKVAVKVSLNGGAAIQRIRILDEHENSGISSFMLYNDIMEYYRLLAEKGDIPTQVGLGQLHYQGVRGVPMDIEQAMRYFQQAADAGNAEAMAYLGKIYLEGGDNIEADNEVALKYFMKAAELNNPVGQSGLGLMYLQGRGIPKDTNQALKYFKLAADQGWVDGQLHLGNMYYAGIGVRRDFKLANKYFYLASQSGHVLAIYNLGQMHAEGMGVLRSCPTAVEFFKTVAERGKWGEQLMLAFHDYRTYEKNKAFVQFAIMAQLGYEIAQSNAAFLLDRGDVTLFGGPPEDYVRALTYWSRAASQGYSAAQVKVGDYHYYGLGTTVDYELAASHYRLASEQQHNAQAMFNLGYMHEQGLGMQRDIHLAKRCYDLAAETSADAKVPVALALLKLMIMFNLESLQENPIAMLFSFDEYFLSNWDIYLIIFLTGVLGAIIYFHRPRGVQQQ